MAHQDASLHHPAARHGTAEDQYLETPPGAQYEHTDANVFIIGKFALWLIISAILIHVGLAGMYSMLIEQASDTAPLAYPLATATDPPMPPEPRLQQFPRNDVYNFKLSEQEQLGSYGWVDRSAGVVHIPIDEAMRLTLERGLPSRPQDPAAPAVTPGMLASDASAGRVMERRRQ